MAQYNQKRTELARLVADGQFDDKELLNALCLRFCSSPFPKKLAAATLWLDFWPLLSSPSRKEVLALPDPCFNHIESRDRKPERSKHLRRGLKRLLTHDEVIYVEGLRLFPHELCRTAEVIGPLGDEKWEKLEANLLEHRLWSVGRDLTDDEFWEATEVLEDYRDLPQPLLDFLEFDRPKEKAPIAEFKDSLQRFLLRKKIERMRSATYAALRIHEVSIGGSI